MFRSIVLAAAAFAALTTAAHAQEQISVSTKGVDVSTAAGAKVLYSRLDHAATAVCGGPPTSFFLAGQENLQGCRKQILDQAVSQLHAPLVAALHGGKADAPAVLASR